MKATKEEIEKLNDAIKHFENLIKKQGMVTNARDENHLKQLKELRELMIRPLTITNKLK